MYSLLVLMSFPEIMLSFEFTVTRPEIVLSVISVPFAAAATVTAPLMVLSFTIQFAPLMVKLFAVFHSAVQSPLRVIAPATSLSFTVLCTIAVNPHPPVNVLLM